MTSIIFPNVLNYDSGAFCNLFDTKLSWEMFLSTSVALKENSLTSTVSKILLYFDLIIPSDSTDSCFRYSILQVTGEETVASVANDAHTRTRDFISESFEGVTVLRTTCLECEHVTERKESFMDICVPIINENMLDEPPLSPSAFYASMLMEVDFLRDSNKYWCEQCVRYNEARRSVHYEKLPRLLVLQLKRFSLSYG